MRTALDGTTGAFDVPPNADEAVPPGLSNRHDATHRAPTSERGKRRSQFVPSFADDPGGDDGSSGRGAGTITGPSSERGVGMNAADDPDGGGEGSGGRGVGTAPATVSADPERRRCDGRGDRGRGAILCRAAHTLMLLALVGAALGPAFPAHQEGDGHEHAAVQTHEASLGGGLVALWALASARMHALQGWNALRASDICDDCNLDVDDGCRCECYSGGYDPADPACQD